MIVNVVNVTKNNIKVPWAFVVYQIWFNDINKTTNNNQYKIDE